MEFITIRLAFSLPLSCPTPEACMFVRVLLLVLLLFSYRQLRSTGLGAQRPAEVCILQQS